VINLQRIRLALAAMLMVVIAGLACPAMAQDRNPDGSVNPGHPGRDLGAAGGPTMA